MKKSMKLLGATAVLAVAIPVSAYAATNHQAPTTTPAPAAAVTAQDSVNAEAPGTEVADAAEQAKPDTDNVEQQQADGETADSAEKAAEAPEKADPNEQAQLQKAAKITQQQASDAALKQVNGTVKSVELQDENGTAVYGVQIVDANGKSFDVKVDAATGKVTSSDNGDNEGVSENSK